MVWALSWLASACSLVATHPPKHPTSLESCSAGAPIVDTLVTAVSTAIAVQTFRRPGSPHGYGAELDVLFIGVPATVIGVVEAVSATYGWSTVSECRARIPDEIEVAYDKVVHALAAGDCPGVAFASEAIRALDEEVYRERIASQPQLARCIETARRADERAAGSGPPVAQPAESPEVDDERHAAQLRVFEACRARRLELMKQAYGIVDPQERGEFLLSIPRCVRP